MLREYIGRYEELCVSKLTKHGIYLCIDGDSKGSQSDRDCESVLLPHNELIAPYSSESVRCGDRLKVFLYTDSEDRIIATMRQPYALFNEIALLEVRDYNEYGIFLDLGISKDIFMPTKQPTHYPIGSHILVALCKDKQHRLIAKKDISRLTKPCKHAITHRSYQAIVYAVSSLGFKLLVLPYYYEAMIYRDNANLLLYQTYRITITKVRRDGKLDAIFTPTKEDIFAMIESQSTQGYFQPDAQSHSHFGMSKKGFKKALSEFINLGKLRYDKERGYQIIAKY